MTAAAAMLWLAVGVDAQEATRPTEPERFARWLEEVEPLITEPEKRLFLSLERNHQKDAFIQQFWRVRDPYPRTARNELKERWPVRVAEARGRFGDLADARARVYMVHGERHAGFDVRCTKTRIPAEVWGFRGSDFVDFPFAVVFIRYPTSGPPRVWRPSRSGSGLDQALSRAQGCINGRRLGQTLAAIRSNVESYERRLNQALAKPAPRSREWIDTFVAFSTDFPADARPIEADVDLVFPGRHQTRTVLQALIQVPKTEVRPSEFASYRSYNFQLTGEVVIEDRLFEGFRYKFGFPAASAPDRIPLVFQRFLRPGSYTLILKLSDLNSSGVFRVEQPIEVPALQEAVVIAGRRDPFIEELFAEAASAIEAGETGLRLIPPSSGLLTDFVRFDTLVTGHEIEKVRFYLDDRLVLTKNQPPFNVEIDLGSYPDVHTLRVEGLGSEGRIAATDELLVNAGSYRFSVRLLEPRKGKRYGRSLRARAEVEVPEGRSLDRVELYLNETLMATLYQEPFVQPIVLPEGEAISYVRAVAYLPDGNATEDLVFVNAPDFLEEIEVQFVELYATVLDAAGRPIGGLVETDFSVFEDGSRQTIARFEKVENLPIHVGILIDNSASMHAILGEVRKAALRFFELAIQPRDRAAVITFNSFPHLAVQLTNDRSELGAGLAGLMAEGQTALYDSMMFALYHFTGIKGKRAILVLSDGKDESSRFSFEQTLDYARHAGITIYSIGFNLRDGSSRGRLARLADDTGGRSFFIEDVSQLAEIYELIQDELRSQYLIAYQSSNTSDDGEFRAVELEVDRPGSTVKTLSGYYP